MILVGALISYYTGMLIVKSSQATGRTRYEDIALVIYGPKWSRFTSFLNLVCLCGFIMSYITYIKKAIPDIVDSYSDPDAQIRNWIGNGLDG